MYVLVSDVGIVCIWATVAQLVERVRICSEGRRSEAL